MTIREFLTRHDLVAYADAFEAQRVTLADLVELSEDDLESLMAASSFQDRKRFKTAVGSLGSAPPRSSVPPKASVSSIGSYDLLELIGEGGMGSVYRGRHRAATMAARQGGDVAVKLVHAHLLAKGDISERFRREAEALGALDHPNIVKVHDVVEESGRTAIVMEWVPGRALSAVIGKETGPIPWERAQAMVVPLLSAVAHAHSRGVVHRDLKPENIVITAGGGVKLLDFGIARLGESRGRTKTGTGMGTVDYMAPEQFLDAKGVDSRADVYALGLTLYEMLAGRLPWGAADSEFEVMSRKKEGRIPPPTEFYPSIPPWVVSGVMAAIRPSPLERTQSVAALGASLWGEGVSAKGDVAVEPALNVRPAATKIAPAPPTSRLLLLLAGAVVLAGGGALVVAGVAPPPLAPAADFSSPSVGVMKWIPAGTFSMGSPSSESGRSADETQHSVTLTKGYWMMEHEVTQGEWEEVMGTNPSEFTACGATCPVELVSWDDAVAFAEKASVRDGETYRLPTEAEWERAARGVREGEMYAGGNDLAAVGWTSENSGDTTHPVCKKQRNGYGLCDMTGNVWEWTSDWYAAAYPGTTTDRVGAPAGSVRVFRGGSWDDVPANARVANRSGNTPGVRWYGLGVRLVRSSP